MRLTKSQGKTILLLAGTAETSKIALRLASKGHRVIVSTATDLPLNIGSHPKIQRRCGQLDRKSMALLIARLRIEGVIDATHPYAHEISATASIVAERLGLPIVQYIRPATISETDAVTFAINHKHAASLCIQQKAPVLLTIGTNNLNPYVNETTAANVPLYVRILPNTVSIMACHDAGLVQNATIPARGPFSIGDNRELIARFRIGVLVTKDSGAAGGTPQKLEAARLQNCEVIVVTRPRYSRNRICHSIDELIHVFERTCP